MVKEIGVVVLDVLDIDKVLDLLKVVPDVYAVLIHKCGHWCSLLIVQTSELVELLSI